MDVAYVSIMSMCMRVTLINVCYCSEQEVEVRQPGGAGGSERFAHPQHQICPHVAWWPFLCNVSRCHGWNPESLDLSGAHPDTEEM